MRAHLITASLLATILACGGGADAAAGPVEVPAPAPAPPSAPPPIVRDTTTPQLVDLGVTFAPYDSVTGLAGDFDLRQSLPWGPMGGFGRTVVAWNGELKALPSFDYRLRSGVVLRAPFAGVVGWVRYQPSSADYEILVYAPNRSYWWFNYDHVGTVLVDSGATVRAGDPIATSASSGLVELTIANDATGRAHCPMALAAPARRDSLRAAMVRLVDDWRARAGADTGRFTMPADGCFVPSMANY